MSQDPWPEVTAAEAIAARGIANEAEYEAVLTRIDQLMDDDAADVTPAFTAELEALVTAVEAYEKAQGWVPGA